MGIPSCFVAWLKATVSASAVELEVEPWRRTAQLMGQRRPVNGLSSSRRSPEVDFVSSESPHQSASDHMTSCTSCRSSGESSEWRAIGPADSRYAYRRVNAASCVVVHLVTTRHSLCTATEMSGRATRLRNNSVATWLEALDENLPGSSPSRP